MPEDNRENEITILCSKCLGDNEDGCEECGGTGTRTITAGSTYDEKTDTYRTSVVFKRSARQVLRPTA